MSMEELIQANDRLRSLIYTLDNLSSHSVDSSAVEAFSVISLARKIAPSSIPPSFIRFNSESGPLEPIPNLYQVPFPTLENFKISLLKSKISVTRIMSSSKKHISETPIEPARHVSHDLDHVPKTVTMEKPTNDLNEDEEYADEF